MFLSHLIKTCPTSKIYKNLCCRVVILNTSSSRPDHLLPAMQQITPLLPSLVTGSITLINDAGDIIRFRDCL